MLGVIVDIEKLVEVAIVSLVGGVGVTISFSLAILGATRFVDLRRDGRPIEAGAYAILMALGLAISLAAVAFGLIVMTTK